MVIEDSITKLIHKIDECIWVDNANEGQTSACVKDKLVKKVEAQD